MTWCQVGLACHTNRDGGAIWYGGGKLSAELTLPKLRQGWPLRQGRQRCTGSTLRSGTRRMSTPRAKPGRGGGRADPALFRQRSVPGCGRRVGSGRRSARCGSVLRNPALHRAADAYDRAARAPYGRIPRCTYAGDRLRFLARRLVALGLTADSRHAGDLADSLAMLTTAVANLRAAQHHAAQAAAARRAAEHLRRAVTSGRPTSGGQRRACAPLM